MLDTQTIIDQLQPLFSERAVIEKKIAEILIDGVAEETVLPSVKRPYTKKAKQPVSTATSGKGRRISDETKAAIITDYQSGTMKSSEIYKKHMVSLPTFYNIVKNVSVSVPVSGRIKEYLCLGCGQTFKSTLLKLDAYCPGKGCNKTTELEEVN